MKEYRINKSINCIDSYIYPENLKEWLPCPRCGLKPKIWIFDNGKHTACGCWNNMYDRFSISAESIGSFFKRTGGTYGYVAGDRILKENWNAWCVSGEIKFQTGNGQW